MKTIEQIQHFCECRQEQNDMKSYTVGDNNFDRGYIRGYDQAMTDVLTMMLSKEPYVKTIEEIKEFLRHRLLMATGGENGSVYIAGIRNGVASTCQETLDFINGDSNAS